MYALDFRKWSGSRPNIDAEAGCYRVMAAVDGAE